MIIGQANDERVLGQQIVTMHLMHPNKGLTTTCITYFTVGKFQGLMISREFEINLKNLNSNITHCVIITYILMIVCVIRKEGTGVCSLIPRSHAWGLGAGNETNVCVCFTQLGQCNQSV